ncbi:hypothetical protein CV_0412 [Chromobacterium violaceum ATCC 12472]|uniref:Uncharacterized protein n=1 Tax=Chromobacterium violaceum (strain ATCC 12472 / DSM 30191 / JCM 1249 / CCUG 213 / NBRC 12614 / NCIMB 9131 / NCTC 9757 / MK) TaxID=243365 RepID=Q7NPT3_CHRVO|nr:hypothetical protein CV_0412 [Chromobacterium violaceum ATCC 12472]
MRSTFPARSFCASDRRRLHLRRSSIAERAERKALSNTPDSVAPTLRPMKNSLTMVIACVWGMKRGDRPRPGGREAADQERFGLETAGQPPYMASSNCCWRSLRRWTSRSATSHQNQ